MLPEMVEPHSYKIASLAQCASAWLWASLWTSFPRPWPGQCLVSQAFLSTLFFCPCVIVSCTHTYMHMLVFICACYMCSCGSQRITVGIIPPASSTWKKKMRPVTHQVGCAGWALRPRDLPVSTSPELGLQDATLSIVSTWVPGMELRSLCLHKHLSDRAISLALCYTSK